MQEVFRGYRGQVFFGIFLIFLYFFAPFSWSQIRIPEIRTTYQDLEAKAWLTDVSAHEGGEIEGFSSIQEVISFVDELYAAGAIYVGVVLIKEQASGFRITLPLNKEKRTEIFKRANNETLRRGYRQEEDQGQGMLTVWF